MHSDLSLNDTKKEWHGTLTAYAIGFILSLVLTGISFSLVIFNILSGSVLIYILSGLAIFQAVIQLIFFLHVGQESKPRWETLAFLFMVLVLFIVVIGSLWIMYDLDARVMQMAPND